VNVRLAFLITLAAAPALAVDAFEIQIYDGSADAPGQAGLEVHVNQPKGGPLHFTLEPSLGVMIDKVPQARARIATAHRRLLEALEGRDADGAHEWMARHIRDFRKGYEIAGIDLALRLTL